MSDDCKIPTDTTRFTQLEDGTGSDGDNNEEPVELLVNTRAKRSTAGNRLHTLLQQQESDDELELIFAEDEEDTGFLDVEADQSDLQMDSSTDEEDHGPGVDDELEGEKDLQKAIKAAQLKNRKNRIGMSKILKKARIEAAPSHSAIQPKKKPERASWLPTSSDTPVRASSRRTTRQSKQELQVQMMDREIKRLKLLATMEKTAAAKAAKETPPLTQEDRLKEAARVEKANAKSLSRWERAEREREEEQRLRMANLHNRHLEGPIITIWSGMATYVGGKPQKIGKCEIVSKEKPIIKKRKLAGDEEASRREGNEVIEKDPDLHLVITENETEASNTSPKPLDGKATASSFDSKIPSSMTFKTVSQVPNQSLAQSSPQYSSSCLAPPAGLPLVAPSYSFLTPPSLDGSSPLPGLGYYLPQGYRHYPPMNYRASVLATHQTPSAPLPPPITEHCLRSSLIFTNFSETAIKNRDTQLNILFPHLLLSNPKTCSSSRSIKASRARGSSRGIYCAITNYPAKYKDPKTGLYYSNLYAYKQLQKLQKGEILWSDLVGSFVGSGTLNAARGVPNRFKGEMKEPV